MNPRGDEGASQVRCEEPEEWFRGRHATHAAPRVVDFVPELPRTPSEKMRRAWSR
ncbi:hypothetical protein [Nocardiopsis sp. YSL2]|uniref:hypothetical protein n=1 Tax=Nocardiopsis sp. YSL2 TaxID=2939492 RepID=UPI0026F42B56|nr:hypothetical protein [Nocardiopsis sp. YSL2]